MGLSRLENFLRSFRGNIIYVDPNALDSTDSIENDGTSAARPLKTIQRALIEAARFSHLPGLNNDKFGNTTILVYPGEHVIDNRPGWIPVSENNAAAALLRSGQPVSSSTLPFSPFDASTNFDITSDTNVLYKFNSIHGGVIVPRGTSIVGMDLRKTKIRPKYVPDPTDDDIDRSAIFRLTGSCYLWQLSIFDGNPNGQVFYNYGQDKIVPNFSHHKLTVFEYADGVNNVEINDAYLNNYSANRSDLDMYYEKIGLAYGPPAREIKYDYPSANIDIQTKLDEYRIVGSRGFEVNIASIFCGDGIQPSSVATVELESPIAELDVDTAIRIDGVNVSEFNGQFVVKSVIDATTIEYNLDSVPTNPQGGNNGTLNLVVDTVSSASPYIFNCSLRSVYGMCGLHADGSKSDGFKSMVVAQYTGISLQKDNNAFIKYNQETASYNSINVENIATDSLARYKPTYQNYHIKASNNAFIQCVSVFAIGFSQHFLSESGGDQSITNSNSNFGAVSLSASGYQESAFLRDDVGYITHIIPPKEIGGEIISVEYDQIDISFTKSVSSNRIYFYNRKDLLDPPKSVIDGYRIGAKINDKLNVVFSGITTSSNIVMEGGSSSYEKSFNVQKLGSLNLISANTITLNTIHNFINGESVRVLSKNGNLPEGIQSEEIYYVITGSVDGDLTASQIKLASSLNDALNGSNDTEIQIYNTSNSDLTIVSRVSDKKSGEIGHPIQFDPDPTVNNWYINVDSNANGIFTSLEFSSETSTARSYLTRLLGNRVSEDGIYKYRYVLPKDSTLRARPPSEGYVIQESSSTITGEDEIITQFSFEEKNLTDSTQLRNLRLISGASWSANTATINTELPHNLSVGSKIKTINIVSTGNTTGIGNSGFNGDFTITSLPSSKSFRYSVTPDPGTFVDNTSIRSNTSPHYIRKNLSGTYLVYRSDKIQEYIPGKQDGVYHLIITSSSNSPDVQPFTNLKFSQPIQNLYPQVDRDNPKSDPNASLCYASPSVIGQVFVNNPENSITKEALDDYFKDYRVDFGISDIRSSSGIAHSIFTNVDHGLNPIVGLSVVSSGSNYGYGNNFSQALYNARLFSSTSKGEGATAVINITSTGSISEIEIMNGGSNYAVNDVLTVVGVATTAGWVPATVTVTGVYNHIGETVQVTGTNVDRYNQLYNIIGITSSRVLQVNSASTITSPINILGPSNVQNSNASLTGNSFLVTHTASGNVTTFVTSDGISHGLQVGDKITFRRTTDNVNLGDYTVRTVVSLTSFTIGANIGNGITSRVLPYKYSSTGGMISKGTESESARLVPNYAGITTTLGIPITDVNDDEINIADIENTGIKIGDYLEIDNEIVKVKQTVSVNPVLVFRGVFGTKRDTHEIGSVVRKISPIPIEFRRNSILRASGHTFEYLGYGSGNYSTAFPDRQDRQLSTQEELLSQSFKSDGGSSIFTGMNSDGDFYVGNKRVSSLTGREEVFDSPIPTSRGEEITGETSLDVTTTSELNVSRRIRIDGGKENNIISEFGGPTIFNEKVTVNNDIESDSLYLQGDLLTSVKFSVSDSQPVNTGTHGDIVFDTESNDLSNITQEFDGRYGGWIYTNQDEWRKFAPIQNDIGRYVGIWSGRFIGEATVRGLTLSGLTTITNTTQSTSKDTGSFVTEGGVGIERNLNVGGTLAVTGVSTFNNRVTVTGLTTITNITDSTTINNGALVVDGGVGIERNLNVGGDVVVYSDNGIISPKYTATAPESSVLGGSLTYKMFRSNGTQDFVTSREIVNALGYIPADSGTVTGDFPLGNSIILDDISSLFNGTRPDFPLTANNGTPFVPAGSSANLLISLSGVIQKAGADFAIIQSGSSNTNQFTFNTPPAAGEKCFIIALGGQGSLISNVDWTTKGQTLVATGTNTAIRLGVGNDGTVLTADSNESSGVKWSYSSLVPLGSVHYMAASSPVPTNNAPLGGVSGSFRAPSGYLICDGASIPITGIFQGIPATALQDIRNFLGSTYGVYGTLPNLIGKFPGYGLPGQNGGSADATLVAHTHTGSTNTAGAHAHTYDRPTLISNGERDNNNQFGFEFESVSTSSAGSHSHTLTIDSAGSSATNANLPPYVGMLPVIKY